MKKITFNRSDSGWYRSENRCVDDPYISLLLNVLNDTLIGERWFIEAMQDERDFGTNICYIHKKASRVIIGADFCKPGEEFEIELDRHELIDLVKQWNLLHDQEVDQIIITRDGTKFTIEGKNTK